MKILAITVALILIGSSIFFYNNYEVAEETLVEDISSYNIQDRYDCKQIQDTELYNKCVRYYLLSSPYRAGEEIVPVRLTNS